MKPTLNDIARKTGLTAASVSMILTGKHIERFPSATVEKVEAAAAELGYVPKKDRKSPPHILIVCPSVINPYFATLLQGMESEADKLGWTTEIANTYWSREREKRIIEMSRQHLIKGVIFAMVPQQPELVEELARLKPVIVVGDKGSAGNLDTVDVNNFNAGYRLGMHLIELGHKHIAYLSTTLNKEHSSRVFRLNGLEASYRTLASEGSIRVLTSDVDYKTEIDNVEIEHMTGRKLAFEFLEKAKEATAAVAINDMIAYGVIDGLKERGYRIPEDYSVCGFDNIYPSKFSGIGLTTIDQFINQKGRTAFSLMATKLTRESGKHTTTHVEFNSELVVRTSTAPARMS
jgi:Transcriptional regulators